MKNACILISLATFCYGQPRPAQGNVIMGVVMGEDGSRVAGVHVTLLRTMLPPSERRKRDSWMTLSGTQGEFQFSLLPGGQYILCGQSTSGLWLDPCEWGKSAPTVVLSGTQPVSAKLTLKRAATVAVRVDDPAGFLEQREGKTSGAELLMGVFNDAGSFQAAQLLSKDAGGRNHRILIPYDVPAKLAITSSYFKLNDDKGTALAKDGPSELPVTAQSGQTPPTVRLVVVGGWK